MRVPATPLRDGELVGRSDELGLLRQFVKPADGPGVIVVVGEPGIGKTSLLRHAVEHAQASGCTVLSASGVPAEAALAFAGVTDLLATGDPGAFDQLPPPQRKALRLALLLDEPEERAEERAEPLDQRAVATAFLALLQQLSAHAPVVVAIDDLQWLDHASALVVSFAARRLAEEAVRVIVTTRPGSGAVGERRVDVSVPGRTQHLHVGTLSLGAFQRLLDQAFPGAFSRPIVRRVWETGGGNPFYGLQIAQTLSHRPGSLSAGLRLPIPDDLADVVLERIRELPDDTIRVLESASAAGIATLPLLMRAHGTQVDSALTPATTAQIVRVEGERVVFTHPLLAETVYQAASAARRRSAHEALADAVDDPEIRVRHLALALSAPDAEVASALEEQAQVVRTRGAAAAAGDLAEQAWRLTPAGERDALRRRVLAARYHFESGDAPRARLLLTDAAAEVADGDDRAWVLSRLARIHMYEGQQRMATELFREALQHAGADTPARADAHEGLATALYLMRERLDDAAEHAAAAVAAARRHDDPTELAAALGTLALVQGVLGDVRCRDTVARAFDVEDRRRTSLWHGDARVMRRPAFDAAAMAMWADDFDAARHLLDGACDDASCQGDDSSLLWLLSYLAMVEYLDGHWDHALAVANDAVAVGMHAGQRPGFAVAMATRALVRASRGDHGMREDCADALRLAADNPAMLARMTSAWAVAALDLAEGRAAPAVEALDPVVAHLRAGGVGEPGSMRQVADHVEALVELGRRDEAADVLTWFESHARRLDRASCAAASFRCRALLAAGEGDLDAALNEVDHALLTHERAPVPFDRARTLLVKGSLLRRARQKAAAREALAAAADVFGRLGASAWLAKTEAEAGRIGGRTRAGSGLTEAEARVAELVAQGMTNREVAAALFITPRTVEYHLSRIYTKLDVRSRTELARKMHEGVIP